jgi:hypothetical protein
MPNRARNGRVQYRKSRVVPINVNHISTAAAAALVKLSLALRFHEITAGISTSHGAAAILARVTYCA